MAVSLPYAGFSCPYVGLDKDFVQYVVVSHARQTIAAILDRYGRYLETQSEGLTSVVREWLSKSDTFDTETFNAVWSLPFGDLYSALFTQEFFDITYCMAAFALRLHEAGLEGTWRATLKQGNRFCFDQSLLPAAQEITVLTNGSSLSVRAGDHQLQFCREEFGWHSNKVEHLTSLRCHGVKWIMLGGDALSPRTRSHLLNVDSYGHTHESIDPAMDLLLRTTTEAIDVIDKFSNPYLDWVANVIRNLIPLPETPGVLNSASGNFWPGAITVSNQSRPSVLAEMLVHEATHQYLYVLKRLGAIDDGSDQTLYYSPARKMGRPLTYIVFAYHAFGNVLLFYREALAHGLQTYDPVVDLNAKISRMEEDLEQLERPLQSTTALTDLGRGLWEPLYEALHN